MLTVQRDCGRLLCSFLLLGFQLGQCVTWFAALFRGFQGGCFVLGMAPAWRAVWADNSRNAERYGHSKRLRYVNGPALMPRRGLEWEEASREGGSGGTAVGGARVQHPPVFWRGGLVATEVVAFEHLQLLWQSFLRGSRGSWWLLLVHARAPAPCCPPSFVPFKLPILFVFIQVIEWVRPQCSGFNVRNKNASSWSLVSWSVVVCANNKQVVNIKQHFKLKTFHCVLHLNENITCW